MNSKVTLIAALAISCSASFIIGRAWSDADDPSASGNPEQQLTGPRAQGGSMRNAHGTDPSGALRTNRSSRGFAQAAHSAQSILNNSDAVARTKAWANFVDRLDAGSFEETANRLLQTGYSKTREHEFSMLLSAWAKQDPLSALSYADQQMQENGTSLHQAALASWATTDPEAAIEYAKSRQSSKHSSPWMLGVIEGLAGTDPARANELLAEMPRSRDRYKALLALQSHYLAQGPEAARNWAMGMEDDSLRNGAIGQITQALAKTDPKGTIDWLMDNYFSVPSHAISSALAELAKTDLAAASAYLSQFENDVITRRRVIGGITTGLAQSDPQAALDFLEANPSPDNDMSLLNLAVRTAQTHPEIAAAAKDRIQAPTMRTMAESSINHGGGLSAPSSMSYNDFMHTLSDADVFGADSSIRISGAQMSEDSVILMPADSPGISWRAPSMPEPEE